MAASFGGRWSGLARLALKHGRRATGPTPGPSWVVGSRSSGSAQRAARIPRCRAGFQTSALHLRPPPPHETGQAPPSAAPGRKKPAASRPAKALPYRPRQSASGKQEQQEQQEQQKQQDGPETKQALDGLFSQRRAPFIGMVLLAGGLGFYIMPLVVSFFSPSCCADGDGTHGHGGAVSPDAVPTGLPPISVSAFDAGLDVPERMQGISKLRKQLANSADGDVLEVAIGTGRNISYYRWNTDVFDPRQRRLAALAAPPPPPPPPDGVRPLLPPPPPAVTSFTGLDMSGEALDIARRRLRIAVPGGKSAIPPNAPPIANSEAAPDAVNILGGRVRLLRGDAMQPLPVAPPPAPGQAKPAAPNRYDTVIQTFGLCSVADPVRLLANMAAVVQPGSGRIVLLEHGRGGWSAVNMMLDRFAGRHFARFGCWWNRDMAAIIDQAQAAVPGLEVVKMEQPGWFQFGTLWRIELRVRDAGEAKK